MKKEHVKKLRRSSSGKTETAGQDVLSDDSHEVDMSQEEEKKTIHRCDLYETFL
jgi:hypothetical protein